MLEKREDADMVDALEEELQACLRNIWESYRDVIERESAAPGWLMMSSTQHPLYKPMQATLRHMRERFPEQQLCEQASHLYFTPEHRVAYHFQPERTWQQTIIRRILEAIILLMPPHDLNKYIVRHLNVLMYAFYRLTVASSFLRARALEDIGECCRVLLLRPESELKLVDWEVSRAAYMALKIIVGGGKSEVSGVRWYRWLREMFLLLYKYNVLPYSVFYQAAALFGDEIMILNEPSQLAAYRERYIDELVNRPSELHRIVLVRMGESGSLRGFSCLLRAARLLTEQPMGISELQSRRYGYLPESGNASAIWALLKARDVEPIYQAEYEMCVTQLRQFPITILKIMWPLATNAHRLICDALGWSDVRPLLEYIEAQASCLQPADQEGEKPGLVDIEEVRMVLESVPKERAREMLDLFMEAGVHKDICYRISSIAGWNRQRLLKSLKHHSQIAIECLGLLPLERGEEEVLERYLRLREIEGMARKFGPQRRVSHKQAAQEGMKHLAQLAGYADATLMEWDMEAHVARNKSPEGKRWEIGEYGLTLRIEGIEVALDVERKGRMLKAIPKEVRASEAYKEAKEVVQLLRDQVKRLRTTLLEELVASEKRLTPDELRNLTRLPLARRLLESLVLANDENTLGLFDSEHFALRDLDGCIYPITQPVRVAHTYTLFQSGALAAWQHEIVHRRIVQPVKQVFRELYILTPAEREAGQLSRRFAGHWVRGNVAGSLLGSRQWRLREYDACFKSFGDIHACVDLSQAGYYEGFIVGEPMLVESVYFRRVERKVARDRWQSSEEEIIPLEEVPPLVFSEVMRDIDLVVSVAQAEGRQENYCSNEVYERRRELLHALLEDLGLEGVTLDGHFAHVRGKLARYRVHLSSGVIHIEPGHYLCIVPQNWGGSHPRLFLPFADMEDARIGEIMSKILLLLEDDRIKDESILRQIDSYTNA